MINENELKEKFKQIASKRKDERQKLINELSLEFLSMVKQKKLLAFPKEHLNYLLDDLGRMTKQRTTNEILKFLLENKLIREKVLVKNCVVFENKPLSCNDYGSYNLMMTKNGYKRVLFNYEKQKNSNLPIKRKIKTLKMSDAINNEFDLSEVISYKPTDAQGVFNNSNMSVLKKIQSYEKKIYELI